ncbi:ATP-binding cassette domain-containing protein [Streptococcus equi]|uniref:ATP-binding cassette domain-containing protein n=1 Tax=Streptococcus equi TaxID=1336 RepID=UPI001E3D5629|nr:ATP-binding cassette domain-containing protein [Streptococcus equi]
MEALSIQHYALDTAEKNLLTIDSLTLNQGERVFIIGDNGAGKTSFLKTIIGESTNYSGFCRCMEILLMFRKSSPLALSQEVRGQCPT